MQNTCNNCNRAFTITEDDLAFLDRVSPVLQGVKYSIPAPTHCPDCRQQRRLGQCNEHFLYPGICGLCQKNLVTENPPASNQPIYCRECWYSDKWDPRNYGRDFDFSRPFFDQLYELRKRVPAIALNQTGVMENSDYVHYTGYSKNCYLIAHADYCEDCSYGYGFKKSTSCMDGFYNLHCELCYDGVYIHKSYGLVGCQDCVNCRNSAFLKDCIGCSDCFLCTGLRNAQYCFENKQLTKEEYEAKMKEIDLGSYAQYKFYKAKLREMEKKMKVKEYTGNNIENSTGNYLQNCKNCEACFDVEDGEDLKNCYQLVLGAKDSRDIYQYGTKITLCYECTIVGDNSYHILFSNQIFINNTDLIYCCFLANGCKSCFGCANMKNASYCILNKQYSPEEYEIMVAKIIEHMRKTGEWGEFLPLKNSLFGYNKTYANLYYPLSKEEVLEKGWKWDDYEPPMAKVEKSVTADKLPDNIKNTPDIILDWAIQCEKTGRPFKIQALELSLLRKMNLPIPRLHPDERHKERFLLRNPRKLWQRNCAKCQKQIQTTYSPEKEESVLCETCYLA